jgi:phage shock protein C
MSIARSRRNKVIAGVCAGISKKIHLDPNILRIVVVISFFCTGFFPIGFMYILAWILMPTEY